MAHWSGKRAQTAVERFNWDVIALRQKELYCELSSFCS